MTLIGAMLNKAKSVDNVTKKYASPPPEIDQIPKRKRKKVIDKYKHVKAAVDSAPPSVSYTRILPRNLSKWRRNIRDVTLENTRLVMAIKKTHFNRGKVDNYWTKRLHHTNIYYDNRVNFYKRVQRDNKALYSRLVNAIPRIATTAELERNWQRNRREILYKAVNKFVLFPPVPRELIEDAAFIKPPGLKRQRVYLSVRFRAGAVIGELKVELFEEVCPETCKLFLELLDGDTGFGYIGTCFFRKVPGLFWRGGDVARDCGGGCYLQRGRRAPQPAENYHFPHSMPGLLSMPVTRNNEVCGIFNITFKPLPQFDLNNVVFARIVRPCKVYEAIRGLGAALSTQPVVEIASSRRLVNNKWRQGAKNTKLLDLNTNQQKY